MTRVAIFDLDGTLAETMAVDVRCYVEAIHAHFGEVPLDTEWDSYPHVTDTGVIGHLYVEQKEIRRVGGTRDIQVQPRIMARQFQPMGINLAADKLVDGA